MTPDQPLFEIPPLTGEIKGMRLGIPKPWFYDDLDPDIAEAVSKATNLLIELGASTIEIGLPQLNDQALQEVIRWITPAEAFTYHEEIVRQRPEEFGPVVRERIELGSKVTAAQYIRALQARQQLMQEVQSKIAHVDALIAPTTPMPALPVEDGDEKMNRLLHNTWPINRLGLCAITVPCGFTSGGLPIGLQIIGKPYDEATILQIAYAYEHQTDWHRRQPQI